MSKSQTDIRTTSYDIYAARPDGYTGTIEDVLAQVRAEPDTQHHGPTGRTELRHYLGLPPKHLSVSAGPSLELDESPRYGFDGWTEQDDLDREEADRICLFCDGSCLDETAELPVIKEPGFYTLEYAKAHWPQNFSLQSSGDSEHG